MKGEKKEAETEQAARGHSLSETTLSDSVDKASKVLNTNLEALAYLPPASPKQHPGRRSEDFLLPEIKVGSLNCCPYCSYTSKWGTQMVQHMFKNHNNDPDAGRTLGWKREEVCCYHLKVFETPIKN